MKKTAFAASLLASAVVLAACGGSDASRPVAPAELGLAEPMPPPAMTDPAYQAAPVDAFLANIAKHCGQAFAGRVRVDTPETADSPFANQPIVMHVRECKDGEIRIPLHVGEDRSRTWVLTRTAQGLRLKHDHRHADGSPDPVTMYGGDTASAGSERRQAFPVDAASVATFQREGLAASVTNTWAMEIEPGRQFVYELSRPGGRLFQIEFDLAQPVTPPPAPWGSSPTPAD